MGACACSRVTPGMGRVRPAPMMTRRRAIGDAASDALQSALSSAGFSSDQVQQGITAYTGIDQNTQDAILGIATHGLQTAAQLAPIIAAGLLATGVGAPVAAVVAGLLPVVDDLLGLFAAKPPHCNFMVGPECVTSAQPYGPLDPRWIPFAVWLNAAYAVDQLSGGEGSALGLNTVERTFPLFWQVMHPELATLGTSTLDQFKRAYYVAWKANEEFYINGYKAADPYALLTSVVKAWNATHLAAPTQTFAPGGSDGSYITRLLNGDVDQRRRAPVTVNLGGVPPVKIAHVLTLHFPQPAAVSAKAPVTAAPASSAGTVLALGAVAASGWYLTTPAGAKLLASLLKLVKF